MPSSLVKLTFTINSFFLILLFLASLSPPSRLAEDSAMSGNKFDDLLL